MGLGWVGGGFGGCEIRGDGVMSWMIDGGFEGWFGGRVIVRAERDSVTGKG